MGKRSDEFSKTEQLLREQVRAGVADLEAYLELAAVLYRSSQLEATLKILEAATALKLTRLQQGVLLNERAQYIFVIHGRSEEALDLAEQAILILGESSPTAEIGLAQITAIALQAKILWDKDRGRATRIATEAISRVKATIYEDSQSDPESLAGIYVVTSQLCSLLGRVEDAIAWVQRALAQPIDELHRVAPLVELGILLRQNGRNEEAKRTLVEALVYGKMQPARENPRIYHELGLVEKALGGLREAAEHFKHALQSVNNDEYLRIDRRYVTTLHLELAETYSQLGEDESELRVYCALLEELNECEADYWMFRLSVARCKMSLKKLTEARDDLTTIITSSASPLEMRELARGDLLSLRYTVALNDYEAGRYPVATSQLEFLLTESINDENLKSDVVLLLGHSYGASGQFLKARTCYEELVKSASATDFYRSAAMTSLAALTNFLHSRESKDPGRVN